MELKLEETKHLLRLKLSQPKIRHLRYYSHDFGKNLASGERPKKAKGTQVWS